MGWFFEKLADMVESIEVIVKDVLADTSDKIDRIPFSVVKEMLRDKCSDLTLNDRATYISLKEADQLLQYFHHLEKKVTLETWTRSESANVTCGNYRVNTINHRRLNTISFDSQ